MGSIRYLNAILTVLTLMLTLNLWTTWTSSTLGDNPAHAQVESYQAAGIPNAAQQRKEMTDLLKKVNESLGQMQTLLESGKVRVLVETPAQQ